jgi:hypothetical protein
MDVVKSEKQVDGGSMVTSVISGGLTEDTKNSEDCCEKSVGETAEMHNGGEQAVTSENSVGDKKQELISCSDAQDFEHAPNSVEKWQLHFDSSESDSTSDNYGSEVEANERNGGNALKQGDYNSPLNSSDTDSEDFLGFEMDAATSQRSAVLDKLIGELVILLSRAMIKLTENIVVLNYV